MRQARKGDTVRVHYTGRLEDGTIFDSSLDRDPLEFTLGSSEVIPGFDRAVDGMSVGEKKTIQIAAADAFGPHRPEAVFEVDRSRLPEGFRPALGERYQITHANGSRIFVEVTYMSDDSVTFDSNHPLAGHDLTFEITLISVG